MFTKKYLERLAYILSDSHDGMTDEQYKVLCNRIANHLMFDNPKFKRGVFLRACGIES